MSAISRRPPSDRGLDDAPVAAGYLLGERLSEEAATSIAARLDDELRARSSTWRRVGFTGLIAATAAAAAILLGFLLARNPAPNVPRDGASPVARAPAPRLEAAPPIPPAVAPMPPRGSSSVPERPSPPLATPRVAPEKGTRAASAEREAVTASEKQPPQVIARDREVAAPLATPSHEERIVRMLVRRTDDPSRASISMTIRYWRPAESGSKEVPR